MATPTMVTVTGTLMIADGVPDVGAVITAIRPEFNSHQDGTVYGRVSQKVSTDIAGAFSLELVASDDPDWVPVGWTYEFQVRPGDGSGAWSFYAPVPEADTAITFGELVPVATPGTPEVYSPLNHTHPDLVTGPASSVAPGKFS